MKRPDKQRTIPVSSSATTSGELKEELLLDELLDYLDETIGMVHHPLIIRDVAHGTARINAEFLDKQAKAEHAFTIRDWELYIGLHERPYRPEGLMECSEFGLTGDDYWRIVAYVWTDSESIYQDLETWKDLGSRDIPGRHLVMDDEEHAWLGQLPDQIDVWRGTTRERSIPGSFLDNRPS